MHDINDKLPSISIASVGDISFRGSYESAPNSNVFKHFKPVFEQADFVLANLESPLVSDTTNAVPGKCTLSGITQWAEILKSSGISLVTLANNHMMDYGVSGLSSTIQALNDEGILHVGAGMDAKSAYAPVVKEFSGIKMAFLGRCSVEVSTPCYANTNQPGVALLDEDELIQSIRLLKENVDHVVVMLHWGIEDYLYPTPQQRQIAKNLASAGATIILGHHPHVLQGEEHINGSLISYSSGNFLFDDFEWSIQTNHGEHNIKYRLKNRNREGMLLEINTSDDGQLRTKRTFSRINNNCIIDVDNTLLRQKQYKSLCSLLHYPLYNFLWKIYSIKQEWNLRLRKELSPSRILRNIHKIRPRHFHDLYLKFRRSARLSAGKSTNPYED
jgi:poly-gamma-glutamate capsule biosynthesis protein CapA/YwtB (metallophosphatase superfamily)